MSRSAVCADSVSFSYGSRTALEDVSFDVPQGGMFALLGPNGSGKTTLFRLMCTLLTMQSGELRVCGFEVSRDQVQVRRSLGATFQSPAVDLRLTVVENLRCHGALYGLRGKILKEKTQTVLRQFELTDRASQIAQQLSGGLRRRVELAQCFLHEPRVLLLDEPTSGLDPRARQQFWDLVLEQKRAHGTAIIVATHLMPEAELCDEVLLLNRGRMVETGAPMDLRNRLGGERLMLRVHDPESVRESVERLLQTRSTVSGDRLSLRLHHASEQIPSLMQLLGDRILSLELARPTLEDVFLERTGRLLEGTEAADEQ